MSEDSKEIKLSKVEGIKSESLGLYGDIAEEVAADIPAFSEPQVQLLKHHGTYQQDNRDVRTERKKQGLEKEYRMMLRTKFPGGGISAEQYLICDDLADKYGQSDLRITSRQCFQFHGVVKGNLRPLINSLNKLAEITSIGACGDVVRNTIAPAVADIDSAYVVDLQALARKISAHFIPATSSYFDIWLDDEKVVVGPEGKIEYNNLFKKEIKEDPIYGKSYLPRKFKIGICTSFDNSVDVFTNDAGIIAVIDDGALLGYEILVGGGLGHTHRKESTYPRLSTPIAFVQEDEIIPLLEAIVKVQRDYGGRADRKQARMKYLIDQWGMEKFRAEVIKYAGRDFPAPKGIMPSAQPDYLGWKKQSQAGLNYVGLWIENGRIRDFDTFKFRSGIRKIVEQFKPSIRLTPHHNIVLANIADADVDAVQAILDDHSIPTNKGISTLRRLEMACPALPLCGLAMAEAERVIPDMAEIIEQGGHADADVVWRVSGCPNNCSRPRTAELGIIGSGADRYIIYTGGHKEGLRLNQALAEKLTAKGVGELTVQLFDAWKADVINGETFGDWSDRIGIDGLKSRITLPEGAV